MSTLLDRVDSPRDLKSLDAAELPALADEIRALIIETVSRTGGHLASNLGVVELTIALLRTFAPPADKLVWDVGHQTYAYKILTGRRGRFGTLRQYGGLSGFLRRDESEYDAFGAGHSGTALSAALGMAVARDRRGGREHVVAVIGDGAAGCGISLEAMNHLAAATRRLIVVLNDNEMSIGTNVGAISRNLGRLLANPYYNRIKAAIEHVADRVGMGWLRRAYYRTEGALKSLFLRSVLFEEFGLRYVGPIDGHDFRALMRALAIARDSEKPILLHVSTRKGKGYAFAEAQPEKWHGTPCFDVAEGAATARADGVTYSQVLGGALERLAETDKRIVAITAAMAAGTGLSGFAKRFPSRFFDVGISEEHAVVFAAGLATQGLIPVFAVYSTFLQRAVDCIIHDVCLQRLPVVFCVDRAGLVGDDGPTHHGMFDLALLRPAPGLALMQPRDGPELCRMLLTAVGLGQPAAIRYPRGLAPGGADAWGPAGPIPLGEAEVLREGREVQIWALGDTVPLALEAAERVARRGVSAGVVNARFVRPLDRDLLARQARDAQVIVAAENGVVTGGFGAAVEEVLVRGRFPGRIRRFGWPEEFIPHGSPADLMARYGFTAEAMAADILACAGRTA